jgi:4,5-DOPA dioxygenase extradiol
MSLPTLFVSHGSPMHAVLDTRASRLWRALGEQLPRPSAIVVASAHWESAAARVGAAAAPATVHDFGGFPDELYRITYPARGAPMLASAVAQRLAAAGLPVALDPDRGLDHGAWVPLRHLYPGADIPVVPVSIQSRRPAGDALALGAALAALRDEGVLVIGSGHLTHNLREWMTHVSRHGLQPDEQVPVAPYVQDFRAWIEAAFAAADAQALSRWTEAPGALRAHPTPEHFLPLLVAWAAAGPAPRCERLEAGIDAGALAMDAYLFHPVPAAAGAAQDAAIA